MNWRSVLESRLFPWLLLPALWALTYLPNLGARDLRLEEGRRAAPARSMLASQNFTLPTLYGEPYLSKPPLYFWLTAVVGAVRGTVDELTVRLPAVVSVLLGAWAVFGFARGELPRHTRALAALLLLSGFIMLDKGTLGEIETFFCLLIFSAWSVWWNGGGADGRPSPAAWLWVGVLLGLAMLTKGPPALVLFYVPVVAFLARQGRLAALLNWAHPVALVFAVAPLGVWLLAVQGELEARTGSVTFADAIAWWRLQMGIEGFRAPDAYTEHLADFPWDVFKMLLPWSVPAAVLLVPPLARRVGVPDPLRRFLTCATAGVIAFFWLWPTTRARHVMVTWYPLCVMAAVVITYLPKLGPVGRWPEICRAGARLAALAIAAAGVTALVLAIQMHPLAVPTTIAGLVVCLAAAVAVDRLVVRSSLPDGLTAVAASSAIAIFAAWACINGLFFAPYKGSRGGSADFYLSVSDRLSEELPLYTVLTFPHSGEGYYNAQFYFGNRLTALNDFADLPLGRPATVLMRREDAEALLADRFRTKPLNPETGGPLLAAEVTRLK